MRVFSHYTKDSYYRKAEEITKYFGKPINQKQIPMYKKKRRLLEILSDEELSIFFDVCDNYMYKTIFMIIYGSGLRISEATNLRVDDIDSKNMRLFVRNGKGKRERYTVLPKKSLEMLRKCYKIYRPNHPEGTEEKQK